MNFLHGQTSLAATPGHNAYSIGMVLSLNSSVSLANRDLWLVDSSASSHVACCLNLS